MTKKEYSEFHRSCCDKMVEITKRKNSDYTGKTDDPFKNFRRRGELGFLVRMDDKLSRLEAFIEKGSFEVADESFEDTCLDLANYSILLAGYVRAAKAEKLLTYEKVGDVSAAARAAGKDFPLLE
jgi:hypothetical protein